MIGVCIHLEVQIVEHFYCLSAIQPNVPDIFSYNVSVPLFHIRIVILLVRPASGEHDACPLVPVQGSPVDELTPCVGMVVEMFERQPLAEARSVLSCCFFFLVPLRSQYVPICRHVRRIKRIHHISPQGGATMDNSINLFMAWARVFPRTHEDGYDGFY